MNIIWHATCLLLQKWFKDTVEDVLFMYFVKLFTMRYTLTDQRKEKCINFAYKAFEAMLEALPIQVTLYFLHQKLTSITSPPSQIEQQCVTPGTEQFGAHKYAAPGQCLA